MKLVIEFDANKEEHKLYTKSWLDGEQILESSASVIPGLEMDFVDIIEIQFQTMVDTLRRTALK